ncbi:MAG: FAD-dependent oxidoreductase [Candidatus Coatesbacteria bacterium]
MEHIKEAGREIRVRAEVDVLVAGGGTAGPAAAMAAARLGGQTLLLERAGFLGGCLVGGATGFHAFWNVYHREPGAPKVKIVEGISQEIVDRAVEAGASPGHVEYERSEGFNSVFTGLEPERTRLLLYDMVKAAGAQVLLHAYIVAARTEGDRHVVIIESKAGREAVVARQVVDATGDGDAAAALGAPFENLNHDRAWFTSLTFRIAGVPLDALRAWMEANGRVTQIVRAVKPGRKTPEIIRMCVNHEGAFRQGAAALGMGNWMALSSLGHDEITYCNCTGRKYVDNLDPADLTDSEVILRRQGQGMAALLAKHVPGCETARVVSHSPTLGVRLSRIFKTEYEIPRDDVLSGRHHEDGIGFVSFVDKGEFWIRNAGCFGIPYRSLVPLGVENLLVTGRMISSDDVVFQTTRNTVASVEMGEAAGIAAALAVRDRVTPRRLAPALLRETLRAAGAKVDCPELKPA